jgi:hypothetical protein
MLRIIIAHGSTFFDQAKKSRETGNYIMLCNISYLL